MGNASTNELFGAQVFVPGQIWFIELKSSYVNDDKTRPYLVIGSNRRKITLLKLTHGGEFSSNWIYQLRHPDDTVSRIILDAPITVVTNEIKAMYKYTLSRDLFREIYKEYISAMIYHSGIDNEVLSDNFIEGVKNIIAKHDESMPAFARYADMHGVQHEVAEEEIVEVDEETVAPAPEVVKPEPQNTVEIEEINETPKPTVEEVAEEVAEPVVEERAEEIAEVTDETEDEVTEEVTESIDEEDGDEAIDDDIIVDENGKIGRRTYNVRPRGVENQTIRKVSDIVIFNTSQRTSREELNKWCEELGLEHYRFQLNDLVKRGRCTYKNGFYDFVLKANLNRDPANPRKDRNLIRYRQMIISDINRFGVIFTSKLWGMSASNLYKKLRTWEEGGENV